MSLGVGHQLCTGGGLSGSPLSAARIRPWLPWWRKVNQWSPAPSGLLPRERPAVLGAPKLNLRVVEVDVEPVSARGLAEGGRADV